MKPFIKLTPVDYNATVNSVSQPIYVKPKQIVSFRQENNNAARKNVLTVVTLKRGEPFQVTETPKEIALKLGIQIT